MVGGWNSRRMDGGKVIVGGCYGERMDDGKVQMPL